METQKSNPDRWGWHLVSKEIRRHEQTTEDLRFRLRHLQEESQALQAGEIKHRDFMLDRLLLEVQIKSRDRALRATESLWCVLLKDPPPPVRPAKKYRVNAVSRQMKRLSDFCDLLPGVELRKMLKRIVADELAEITDLAKAKRDRTVRWRILCAWFTVGWYVVKAPATWATRLFLKQFNAG